MAGLPGGGVPRAADVVLSAACIAGERGLISYVATTDLGIYDAAFAKVA